MAAADVAPEVPGERVGAERGGTRLSPALDLLHLGLFWLSLQAQPLRSAALQAQSVRALPRVLRESSEKALQRCSATGSALAVWRTKDVLRCAQTAQPRPDVAPRPAELLTQHRTAPA